MSIEDPQVAMNLPTHENIITNLPISTDLAIDTVIVKDQANIEESIKRFDQRSLLDRRFSVPTSSKVQDFFLG